MNKRILRSIGMILMVCMIIGMMPAVAFAAGTNTVYLKANADWKQANAWFAVYTWNTSGSMWYKMTDSDGDGVYEADVPAAYTNIIFTRMNPSYSTLGWDTSSEDRVWNQSVDLTRDGNCFTVENPWNASYENKATGSWSNITVSGGDQEETTAPTQPAGSKEYSLIGYINGADVGCEGDYTSAGYKFADGKVTVTITEDSYVFLKTTDNANWYMAQSYTTTTSGTFYNTNTGAQEKMKVPAGEVTFTLTENADGSLGLSYTVKSSGGNQGGGEQGGTTPTGELFLFGYINDANYNEFGYPFVNGKLTAKFETDSYVYVLRRTDGKEFMTDGWMGKVSSATLYATADLPNINNANKLYVPGGVEVTFTLVDNGNNTYNLSYTYEGAGSADEYYLFGYINGEDYGEGGASIYKFENNTLTTTLPSDSYVAVKTGDNSVKYYTKGWVGAASSATLYSNLALAEQDKLMVPGGVEVTFNLTVNNDNTVTLSYVRNEDKGIKDTSGIQDGVTLHCWNWSYNNISANMATIAEMGYTAVQVSPAQMMKEDTVGKPVSSHWWVFYQPVDFKMNTSTGNALGTKAEFSAMCAEADKYGIKVIVDVVANHLANATGNDLSPAIPDYLRNNSQYWHDYTTNTTDYTDRQDITQHCMAGLPDLNTANKELQGYVLDYLKECIDAGADGFRFDATKHIETPEDDAAYASDFWPTVVGGAEAYAKSKGFDLYCYGELLDAPGGDKLPLLAYTKHLAVTDNSWGNCLRNDIAAGVADYNIKGYNKAALPEELVLWAESHDTYSTDNTAQNSSGISIGNINKTWALVAARSDAMGLYFVRPNSGAKLGDAALNTGWANAEVKAVNKFHNAFVGQSEKAGNSGNLAYVVRGTTGIVLVNVSGNATSVSGLAVGMTDGTYTDQVSGASFTVSGGKISGSIGSTGIAVVYNATVTPDPDPEPTYTCELNAMEVSCDAEVLLRMKMIIGEDIINDDNAYVVMTKNGKDTIFTTADLRAKGTDNKGRYILEQGIASGEMTYNITLKIYNGKGELENIYDYVSKEVSTSVTRSVLDYAERIFTVGTQKQKDLIAALVTYGGYSQLYFGKDTSNPAYNVLTKCGMEIPNIADISASAITQEISRTGDAIGITQTTSQVYLDSAIYMRVFFVLDSGKSINDYTFTLTHSVNNVEKTKELEPVYDAARNRYYVDIEDIPAAYLDYMYAIAVTNGAGTYTVRTSAMAWAKLALNAYTNPDQLNMIKALYFYNQAANTYFGK